MSIVEITLLFPVLAALAIAFGSPARFTALAGAILTTAGAFITAAKLSLSTEGQFQFETSHTLLDVSWFPQVNLAFGVDGVSVVMMILTALVLFAAILNSPPENNISGRSPKFFYACCLLIGAGSMGVFCTTDLFFLYVFHEIALIAVIVMISAFGHGDDPKRQAMKLGLCLSVGSLFFLIGLIMTVRGLGGETLDISDLIARARDLETGVSIGEQGRIFLFLLIGISIFTNLFPFHHLARSAFSVAPKPVAMLHSGVLKSCGVYGLIRVAIPMLPHGANDMTGLILLLAAASIIGVGVMAIRQKEVKQMLAYSSVMYSGYAFLGIASGTRTGMIGAVLLLFAHGLCVALQFAQSDRSGSVFRLAALATSGLPGFAIFPAQLMIFFAAFEMYSGSGYPGFLQWIGMLAIGGMVISAICMRRACRINIDDEKTKTSPTGLAAALILLAPLIVVGFAPDLVLRFIRAATEGISLFGLG